MSSHFFQKKISTFTDPCGLLFQHIQQTRSEAYYATLFAMPESRRMRDKKHQRIQPYVLPLSRAQLPRGAKTQKPWSITLVNKGFDIRHLVPPKGHRINESAYREANNWVKAEFMELLYDLRPGDKSSPIKRVFLGVHKNAQVSVMIMPQVGVSEQVWRNLSGVGCQTSIDSLDSPETPNDFVYQYALKAGTDLRARACLIIRVDNEQDIARLESFLAGIDRITPLCSPLLNHCHDLLETCRKTQLEIATDNTLKPGKWWQPKWQMEKDTIKDGFTGFPNHIPDMVDDQSNNLYQPHDCLHFPSTLPPIHQAILAGDRELVLRIVDENIESIYQRNPWGHLPIEVANAMRDKNMAADLFEAWERLPSNLQWAHSLFYRAANNTTFVECEYIEGDDHQIRQQRADAYLGDCLPGVTNALAVYQAIRAQDVECYQQLMATQSESWQQLLLACEREDWSLVCQLVANLMPARQQIFAAALCRDIQSLMLALDDYFPDLSLFRDSVYAEPLDWSKVERGSQQPVLRDWVALQSAIADKDKDQIIKLLHNTSDKWWNLRQQRSAKRYALFDDIKKHLRENIVFNDVDELIQALIDYLKPWHELRDALEDQNDQVIERWKSYFTGEDKPGFLFLYPHDFDKQNIPLLKKKLYGGLEMPEHFSLVYAALRGDWEKVRGFVRDKLEQAQQLQREYGSLSQASQKLSSVMPKRNTLHQQAIAGVIPENIEELHAEQIVFNRVGERLTEISKLYIAKVDKSIDSISATLVKVEFKEVYYQDKYHQYTLKDYWQIYSRTAVFNQQDYQAYCQELDHCLQKVKSSMKQLHPDQSFTLLFQGLEFQFYEMKRLKFQAMCRFQQCFKEYRTTCRINNSIDFDVYMSAYACRQFQAVVQTQKTNFKYGRYQPVARLLEKYKQLLSPWQVQGFAALRDGAEVHAVPIMRILRAGLLSFERQDAWGYTPLLLAVIADHHAFVEAFLLRGLFSERIKVMYESGYYKHYSLIDHVRSERMAELLLRHFIDANARTKLVLKSDESIACRMRDYGHRLQLDYGKLNLIERLIIGDWQHQGVDTLNHLLAYENEPLPHGPYDKNISPAVIKCINAHNLRIAKKEAALKSRPKAQCLESHFEQGALSIETEFSLPAETGGKEYRSIIKAMSDVSGDEKQALAESFAKRFKVRAPYQDSHQARIDFFLKHVASNNEYLIDIYVDRENDQICGFFCFQIKPAEHPVYGDFLVFYASIAACQAHAAKSGLASSSFKMMLAAKKLAESKGLSLKCYGRLGRPGIAYSFIPECAKISSKFAISKGLVKFIAEQVIGNVIEPDGSSMPPVLSTVNRTDDSPQLLFYDHLLDDIHQAHPEASLPVVYEVNDDVEAEMLQRLQRGNGIDGSHVELITEKLKDLLNIQESKTARL